MKNLSTLLILVVFSVNSAFAMLSDDDIGTSAAKFLNFGVGARAVGLGENYAAVSNDATAVYWNPAGLSQIEKKCVSVMHAVWFEDIFYDWGSYVQPIKNSMLGVGVQYVSYGSITETDETGQEGSSFTSYDMAGIISYSREIFNTPVGLNIKYIFSKINDETATAVAADIGCMYKLLDERLSLGLNLQNIGTKMKYIDEEDPLPFNIKVGGAYSILKSWLIAIDLNFPNDNEMIYGIGSEYNYKINNDLSVSGRAGYNSRSNETGNMNGMTGGLGVNYKKYNIDYSFMPFGNLGNTHRISLGIVF